MRILLASLALTAATLAWLVYRIIATIALPV